MSLATTLQLTRPEDREEVQPDEGDDGSRQSLIDGSQVDAAFDASGQVGKVEVVFVHQVSEHHVEQACDRGDRFRGWAVMPSKTSEKRRRPTEGRNHGTDDAVGHDDGEHAQRPAVHGSIFKFVGLVLKRV